MSQNSLTPWPTHPCLRPSSEDTREEPPAENDEELQQQQGLFQVVLVQLLC